MLIVFLAGCNSEEKIDSGKLSKVYVDLLIVNQRYAAFPDSIEIYRPHVFDKYKISEEAYSSQLEKMKKDGATWDEFFKSSLAYLDTLKANGQIE